MYTDGYERRCSVGCPLVRLCIHVFCLGIHKARDPPANQEHCVGGAALSLLTIRAGPFLFHTVHHVYPD